MEDRFAIDFGAREIREHNQRDSRTQTSQRTAILDDRVACGDIASEPGSGESKARDVGSGGSRLHDRD
jgi:uncharacterized membrane protein